jgi:hypothetical protein
VRWARALLAVIAVLAALPALPILGLAGFHLWFHHRSQPAAERRQLFPGIEYVREVRAGARPLVAHVARIDLGQPGLSFLVTPPRGEGHYPLRAQVTSAFLAEHRLQLAVNGDFFWPFRAAGLFDFYPHAGDTVGPLGFAASGGRNYYWPRLGYDCPTLFLFADNRALIGWAARPLPGARNAISGDRLVLVEGRVPVELPADGALEPRSAAGLDRSGRSLLLIAVDGRQPGYSLGASLRELGELARRRGAYTALNFDGGGSTTLVAEGAGRPQVLNSPIHTGIPYRERPVGNHLGVWMHRSP